MLKGLKLSNHHVILLNFLFSGDTKGVWIFNNKSLIINQNIDKSILITLLEFHVKFLLYMTTQTLTIVLLSESVISRHKNIAFKIQSLLLKGRFFNRETKGPFGSFCYLMQGNRGRSTST